MSRDVWMSVEIFKRRYFCLSHMRPSIILSLRYMSHMDLIKSGNMRINKTFHEHNDRYLLQSLLFLVRTTTIEILMTKVHVSLHRGYIKLMKNAWQTHNTQSEKFVGMKRDERHRDLISRERYTYSDMRFPHKMHEVRLKYMKMLFCFL